MSYTSNPVRDAERHMDEQQRRSDAYNEALQLSLDCVICDLARNDQKTVNDIEEELIHSDAITVCIYVREALGKEEAFAALDKAIDLAIERIAARRVKE